MEVLVRFTVFPLDEGELTTILGEIKLISMDARRKAANNFHNNVLMTFRSISYWHKL